MTNRFVPALRFAVLTRFYDPLMAWILREATWKAALVQQVALQDQMRALDVGCGTGTLTLRLVRSAPGSDVTGVDADPAILARARTRIADAGVRARFVEGRAQALPFADASFDRVVSSLVFHHLTRDEKRSALAEIRRVLRPGGELHIADWGRPHDWLMRAAFVPVRLLDGFETTSDNTHGLLPGLITDAGLDDVQETHRRRTVFGTLSFLRARTGTA